MKNVNKVVVFEWCSLISESHYKEANHIDTTFDEWLKDNKVEHDNNKDSVVDEYDYAIYLESV